MKCSLYLISAFWLFSLVSCGTLPALRVETVQPSQGLIEQVEATAAELGHCMLQLDKEMERQYGIPSKNDAVRLNQYIDREAKAKTDKEARPMPSPSVENSSVEPFNNEIQKSNWEADYSNSPDNF